MPGRLSARFRKSQEGYKASVHNLPARVPRMSDLEVVQFIRDRFDGLENRLDKLEGTLDKVHIEVKNTNGRVTVMEIKDREENDQRVQERVEENERRVRRSDEIRWRINVAWMMGGAMVGGSAGFVLHIIFGT